MTIPMICLVTPICLWKQFAEGGVSFKANICLKVI
jgi:hypothetical protein